MGFVYTGLLWLLPLGLIPIIIYYLLRLRSLRITWGSNYVLERALEQLRKKLRLDQLLLMALRILAMVLIVLAFARPVLSNRSSQVRGSGVHHVVLFDGSYSMGAADSNQTRLEQSKAALSELIGTWGRGETWSLCLLGDEPRWIVEAEQIQSTQDAREKLDQLVLLESDASIPNALSDLGERFSGQPVQLFIFADDQATTWAEAERAALPANVGEPVHWLCPPLTRRANAAVTSVVPSINRPVVGQPQTVSVRVRSFADRPIENVPVQLLLNGAFHDRRRVSLLPGQEAEVQFDAVFRDAGSQYMTAQLSDDALAYDDRMHAAVDAADSVSVMVLRKPDTSGLFDSGWEFFDTIRRAIDVAELNDRALRFTLNDGAFGLNDLAEIDVLYLDGGSPLTSAMAATLQDYVARGGGLIAAADANVKPAEWNALLGARGLIPARLGELRVEPVAGEQHRSIVAAQIDHPALASFKAPGAVNLGMVKFFAWFNLQAIDGSAVTLAPLDNLQPWALADESNAGHRVLLATGLSGDTTNIFVRQAFLPLVNRLAQFAASGRAYPRTVGKGEPVRYRLPAGPDALAAVTFGARGQAAEPLSPRRTDAGWIAMVDRELAGGLYSMLTVRGDQTRRAWFAVQGERVDSDLAPLPQAKRAAVDERLAIERSNDWPALQERLAADRRGQELYAWVVGALGLALLGEMLIQRRFVMSRP